MEKRGDVNPAYTPDLDEARPAPQAGPVAAAAEAVDRIEKLAAQGVQPRADGELRRAVAGR